MHSKRKAGEIFLPLSNRIKEAFFSPSYKLSLQFINTEFHIFFATALAFLTILEGSRKKKTKKSRS